MSKVEKIRRALLKYPKANVASVAMRCKVSLQDVYTARYTMKKENEANGYALAPVKKEGKPVKFALDFDATPALITTQPDMVNHPPHYTVGGLEVIDFIEAKELSYHLGNVVKYIVRAGHKNADPLQDLQKARWYLERAISKAE